MTVKAVIALHRIAVVIGRARGWVVVEGTGLVMGKKTGVRAPID
jgi:hypothetical protein